MIISAVLALVEPVAPGQSPIPVVIIRQEHEGMTTGEWWVTVSAFALTGVTLLTMIHVDVVLHHLARLVRAITPPIRRSGALRGQAPSRDTSNTGTNTNKIMSDRSA